MVGHGAVVVVAVRRVYDDDDDDDEDDALRGLCLRSSVVRSFVDVLEARTSGTPHTTRERKHTQEPSSSSSSSIFYINTRQKPLSCLLYSRPLTANACCAKQKLRARLGAKTESFAPIDDGGARVHAVSARQASEWPIGPSSSVQNDGQHSHTHTLGATAGLWLVGWDGSGCGAMRRQNGKLARARLRDV